MTWSTTTSGVADHSWSPAPAERPDSALRERGMNSIIYVREVVVLCFFFVFLGMVVGVWWLLVKQMTAVALQL